MREFAVFPIIALFTTVVILAWEFTVHVDTVIALDAIGIEVEFADFFLLRRLEVMIKGAIRSL